MNEQFRMIAQNYCGMKPKDKLCHTWGEMHQKMADELEEVVKNNIVKPDVRGELIAFLRQQTKLHYVTIYENDFEFADKLLKAINLP